MPRLRFVNLVRISLFGHAGLFVVRTGTGQSLLMSRKGLAAPAA